jgi:P2 family phage contractile tail tube protein
MSYPRTIRNYNCFIDGVSYMGKSTEAKLPELKLVLANHRGAGMDGTVAQDMGMEALQSEVTMSEWSPELIKMFGTNQRMTLRPAAMGQSDFTADSFVATMGGKWTVVNFADLKPGSDVPMKLMLEVDYYRLLKDGDELFEIDIEAGKRIIGGVDQLAGIRAAMGI